MSCGKKKRTTLFVFRGSLHFRSYLIHPPKKNTEIEYTYRLHYWKPVLRVKLLGFSIGRGFGAL